MIFKSDAKGAMDALKGGKLNNLEFGVIISNLMAIVGTVTPRNIP